MIRLAAALVLCLLMAGCGHPGAEPPVPTRAPKPYNVLLVSFDATRAQDMQVYGYGRDTTPNLVSFVKQAVVFQDAISPASWTLPATMSIFTGVWPSVHGVVNKLVPTGGKPELSRLKDSVKTLPQLLAANGYVLGGFTGDAGVTGRFGFGRDFETYVDDQKFGGLDYSAPKAEDWLRAHKDQRFFMFLHGYDAHGQYDPPQGYGRMYCKDYHGKLKGGKTEQARFREMGLHNKFQPGSGGEPHLSPKEFSHDDAVFYQALYDEKIHLADARFAAFLKELDNLGLRDQTVIVLLADHGEEFMEHNNIDHGPSMYEEMLHVPLIMRLPGVAPRTVAQRVSSMDALPTVLDFLGIRLPDKIDGKSLMPLIEGKPMAPQQVCSETDYRLFVHKRCIYDGDYKLIYSLDSHRMELYNLKRDPFERNDLSKSEPDTLASMRKQLVSWTDKLPSNYPDYSTEPTETIKVY